MKNTFYADLQNSSRSPIVHLLGKLDHESIPHVSWKNNHELDMALEGDSDLDLFVPVNNAKDFLLLAHGLGWIRLINPVARFPWIIHLYKLGEDLRSYHLHVYFKVVTGESWLKEFILPFEDFFIEHRVKSEHSDVWILDDRSQAYLFFVRHLLKGGSFFSRILYKRELDSYQDEWLLCGHDPQDLCGFGPIKIDTFIAGSGLTRKNLIRLPKIINSLMFRASLVMFLRSNWISLPFKRIQSFGLRFINKLFMKNKKKFSGQGLIITVSGVDGSGKSTMLHEAHSIFSSFLTVKKFTLGRPQGKIFEAARKIIRSCCSRDVSKHKKNEGSDQGAFGLISSISAAVLSMLRLRMARRATREALKGNLVLVDRWPTDETGMMDGPRLSCNKDHPAIFNVLYSIENWAYSRMPRADICFFLQVPVEILIKRNEERVKSEKETDEEIRNRYQGNQDFVPLAGKIIRFDNNGPFEVKRKGLMLRIWQEIVAIQAGF